MDNFDLKRFLVENYLTRNSILSELSKLKWTKDALEQEAAKYNTASEFRQADISAYTTYMSTVRKGLIQNKFESRKKWTKDALEQEAAKYDTPGEFAKINPTAYTIYRRAVRKGLIPDSFEDSRINTRWTTEKIEQEADKYNTQNEFFKTNQAAFIAYKRAVKKGLIKDKFKSTKDISAASQSDTSSEPYTYDESSLLDFVKKYIGDIEEDVTGYYHGGHSRHYSTNDISEHRGIVFIKGNKDAPTVAILNHTPTQKDLEVTGTNKDDWKLEFDRVSIPGAPTDGPMKQGVNYIKKNFYWHARVPNKPTTPQSSNLYNDPYFTSTTTFDKLKENKMDNFDLKKFLVENKMTRNSKLLNEQPEPDGIPADDPLAQIPAVPAETPSEPSGEIDKETAKELIFNTGGKFFTVNFLAQDKDERGKQKVDANGVKLLRPRTMNARLGVKKYLRGGELKFNPDDFNLINVFDMVKKGYRFINADTIQSLKIGNRTYTVTQETTEPTTDEQ